MNLQSKIILLYIQPASIGSEIMKTSSNKIQEKKLLECCKCKNRWFYHGKNPYFATCSFCKASVNIRKRKVTQVDLGRQAQNQPETIERKVF